MPRLVLGECARHEAQLDNRRDASLDEEVEHRVDVEETVPKQGRACAPREEQSRAQRPRWEVLPHVPLVGTTDMSSSSQPCMRTPRSPSSPTLRLSCFCQSARVASCAWPLPKARCQFFGNGNVPPSRSTSICTSCSGSGALARRDPCPRFVRRCPSRDRRRAMRSHARVTPQLGRLGTRRLARRFSLFPRRCKDPFSTQPFSTPAPVLV